MNAITNPMFKKWLSIGISFVIIIVAFIWFTNTYSDQPLKISLQSSQSAVYEITVDDKVHLNQPFKAIINLHTGKNTVNAIGLNIKYEAEKIRVVSIDTTKSFCQFYPEKKFNDNAGEIRVSCGSPNPGFSGDNPVLIIEFMPVKLGATTLIIDPVSQVLKSDGKGTNILKEYPQKTINILNTL